MYNKAISYIHLPVKNGERKRMQEHGKFFYDKAKKFLLINVARRKKITAKRNATPL